MFFDADCTDFPCYSLYDFLVARFLLNIYFAIPVEISEAAVTLDVLS
jgi:hypothetical protein